MTADFVIAAFYIGFICLFLALVLTPLAALFDFCKWLGRRNDDQ